MKNMEDMFKNNLMFKYEDGIFFLNQKATPDILDKYEKYIEEYIEEEGYSKLFFHIDDFIYYPKVICEMLKEAPMLYENVPVVLKEDKCFINMCLYHNPHTFKYMEGLHSNLNVAKKAIILDFSNVKYVSKSIIDKITNWILKQ